MLGGLLTSLNDFSEAWSAYLEGEVEENSEDPVKSSERGDVDQIVAFFEREYDGHEDRFGRFLGDGDDAKALEAQRVVYFNLTTCIDHQNEQICYLLEELREKRAEFKQMLLDAQSTQRIGRVTAAAVLEIQSKPATQALIRSIEVLKMDITDRKNTRFFKERERQEAAGPLSKLISEIKLRQFEYANLFGPIDESAGHGSQPAAHCGAQDTGLAKKHADSGANDGAQEREDGAVTSGEGFISGGMALCCVLQLCCRFQMCE